MGSIGAPELIVVLLIVGVVAFFVLRRKGPAHGSDLVPCRACGKRLSPRAETCPLCGEPRIALRG
jgi:uncharacterized OB-fold protein